MRSWNARLGIIAVSLSVLALVVALGGRGPHGVLDWPGRAGRTPLADAPVPPAAPIAPTFQFERHEQWQHSPHFGPRSERHWRGGVALGHDPHRPAFFGPFFPLGSPLRVAAALMMIALGLYLLRDRGSSRGPGDRPPGGTFSV